MRDVGSLTFLIFWIYLTWLILVGLIAAAFFRLLKKKHVSYYRQIGSPIVLAPLMASFDSYIQLLKANGFLIALVFKGIPKSFPKDTALVRLAHILRILCTLLLIIIASLITAGYFFYRSTS